MNVFQPWQLVLVTLAGWINRQQQDVIACIQEENRILRNKLKGERIRFAANIAAVIELNTRSKAVPLMVCNGLPDLSLGASTTRPA